MSLIIVETFLDIRGKLNAIENKDFIGRWQNYFAACEKHFAIKFVEFARINLYK